MSWRYAAPVIWTCDRCATTAPGIYGVLPDDWATIAEEIEVWDHELSVKQMSSRNRDVCPSCRAPEEK